MAIGIVIADDHPIFRQGIKALLQDAGFTVIGECGDGYEALRLVQKLRPDVAILDVSMPRLNGIDTAQELLQASPRTRTILLTLHSGDQYIREGLRSGVKGYVLKSEAGASLIQAVQEVHRGNMYLSPGVSGPVAEACRTGSQGSGDLLTERELQILKLIAEGHTTREISEQLHLSVKTAESYRTRLMEKLDIHETANLVRYAIRRGLIKP